MSRVKRGIQHAKRRANILKAAKGFKWARKNKIKLAKTAITKAGAHSYRDRKIKKRTIKQLHHIRISAGLKQYELSYSKFIGLLKKANILLNRKMLVDLASNHPKIFSEIISRVKETK